MTFFIEIIGHQIAVVMVAVLVFFASIPLPKKWVMLKLFSGVVILGAIFNVFFGHQLRNHLIAQRGVLGTAMITHQETTDNIYNEQPVERFEVVLKTAEGALIETTFESWDFNIYPTPKQYIYPAEGDSFAVRYLPDNPKLFVILKDSNSKQAQQQQCQQLYDTVEQAKRKMDFAKDNLDYQKAYQKALEIYQQTTCAPENLESSAQPGLAESKP